MGRTTRGRAALCLAILITALLAMAMQRTAALAADGYGHPRPGQHVYDRTGLLRPAELADLERRANTARRAGAPTIVYLQARQADYPATYKDAQTLMAAWDVESASGTKDGLVIFLNLEPGKLRHGQVALYAGAKHFVGGHLPLYELQRIYSQLIRPLLANGRTAAGIGAGIDAAAHDLTYGLPPAPKPGPVQRAAADLARWPLTVLAALVALALAALSARAWRAWPRADVPPPTTTPPNDLSPALAGALVAGRVGDAQIVATILDLARHGALAIEPIGPKKICVRLLDRAMVQGEVEASVWRSLADEADATGILSAKGLAKVRSRWDPAREVLRQELLKRGWYDRKGGARRRPLYGAGIAAMALGVAAAVVSIVGQEGWGTLGATVFAVSGIAAGYIGYTIPDTTAAAASAAAPWRAYQAGLKAARRRPDLVVDLDESMPYAVALGIATALNGRLKAASKVGYAPAWLGRTPGETTWDGGFYPYWMAFYAAAAPSSSGATSAGAGAAAGGGGAGGAF